MRYLTVIHKDPDSEFGVTVPDLPGCFSAGSTIREALDNAQEAIECHIEGILADGEQPPEIEDEEAHLANPDYSGGVFVFVDVDERKLSGKVHRINITVPEYALEQIDTYSKAVGETRSAFMTRAALNAISGRGSPPRAKQDAGRSVARVKRIGGTRKPNLRVAAKKVRPKTGRKSGEQ
jgi:predicted RNase H-like HicB family nuclease